MDRWSDQIDELTEAFVAVFGSVDESILRQRPAPDRWSVAENLDHLIRFNESYYPQIHAQLAGERTTSFLATIPGLPSLMKRMLHHFIRPGNPRKMKTMNPWIPEDPFPGGEILSDFRIHQESLKNVIQSARPLLERNAKVHSPATRLIVYDLEGAFDMIVDHERRHLGQAAEALDRTTTPSEPSH